MYRFALLVIFCCLSCSALLAQENNKIDSLKSVLNTKLADSSLTQTFNQIAEEYSEDYKLLDSSLLYAQQAYALAERTKNAEELARAAYNLAYAYDLDGQVEQCLNWYEKGRQHYTAIGDLEMVATCMHGKGIACYFQGDYGQSLAYYHEALEFARKNELLENEANTLLNLGVIYRILENYDKAIDIYSQALDIYKKNILQRDELKDSTSLAKVYNNLAVVHTYQKNYEKAIVYLDTCISMYQSLKDSFNLAAVYITAGDTYLESGKNYAAARNYLRKGYGIMKGYDDNVYQSKALLYLGRVELATNNYKASKDYLQKGLKVLEGVEYEEIRRDLLVELSRAYAKLGNSKNAYEALEQSYALNEDINSKERIKYTEEMEVKYETEKKEKEIATLNAEKAISDLKLTNTKRLSFILIAALLIFGFLLFGLYRLYTRYKSRGDIISQTLTEKERLLENLENAQEQIIRSEKMASLGQLTASIAHEINNPINFISSSSESLQVDINEISPLLQMVKGLTNENASERLPEILKLQKTIDIDLLEQEIAVLLSGISEGAERTTEIINGLKHFSHPGKMEKEQADIHQSLDAVASLMQPEFKGIAILEKLYGEIPKVWVTRNQLSQVFINVLSNALDAIRDKASSSNASTGRVKIKTGLKGNEIFISIQDNGAGIPVERQSKIFDPFFTTKDIGVGLGLGLSISYGIIEKHGGRIEFESKEGEGSVFVIWLPTAE